MKKDIRLIAVDMDGTLLNSQGKVSQRNLAAIVAAQRAGVVFSICTGRFFENASIFALDQGLHCPLITLNGGKGADRPFGRVLYRHFMPQSVAVNAFEVLESMDASYFGFGEGRVSIRKHGDLHHSQVEYGTRMQREAHTEYVYGKSASIDLIEQGIYKYYVSVGPDQKLHRAMWERLAGVPGLSVTQSSETNIELMPCGVDKEQGVREMAASLSIGMEHVMAIGDQGNDLPMIRAAGWGVAMGNAATLVKQHADAVTNHHDEDGVARAIEFYVLGKSSGQA